MVSKQFTPIINKTIPIKIAHQKTIGRTDPTRSFREAIPIVIKMDSHGVLWECCDAISVQIKYQRT